MNENGIRKGVEFFLTKDYRRRPLRLWRINYRSNVR